MADLGAKETVDFTADMRKSTAHEATYTMAPCS